MSSSSSSPAGLALAPARLETDFPYLGLCVRTYQCCPRTSPTDGSSRRRSKHRQSIPTSSCVRRLARSSLKRPSLDPHHHPPSRDVLVCVPGPAPDASAPLLPRLTARSCLGKGRLSARDLHPAHVNSSSPALHITLEHPYHPKKVNAKSAVMSFPVLC